MIDAVGGPIGLEASFGLVRRRGTIVSVGVHHDGTWQLPVARSFADELTLRFAIGDAMRDRDQFTALVEAGLIDPTAVVTNTVPLDEAPSAYADMQSQRAVKILLTM